MERYTRQTINYQALPETFSLIVTDVDAINVNFLKEIYRKIVPDYEITQRFTSAPTKNQLFEGQVFAFTKRRLRQRGKGTDT